MQGAPGRGQPHPPVGPGKQWRTKILLQRTDALADGRLRKAEFLGCARKALMPGGGLESDEAIQRGQGAAKTIHKP